MDDMFSNKGQKRIPRNLYECVQPDATVTDLHAWAERIKRWGRALFTLLIVVGILFTVIITIVAGNVDGGAAFMAFAISSVSWGISAFVEYLAYHAIALLISALASITQNTAISANVALFESAESRCADRGPAEANGAMPASGPYAQYVAPEVRPVAPQPEEWQPVAEATFRRDGESNIRCTNCGRVQFCGNKSCSRCGARFMGLEL